MYQVTQFADRLNSFDEDTLKRYNIIKQLSKDFTVKNPTALALDELLAEQIDLESQEEDNNSIEANETTSIRSSHPIKTAKTKTANNSELETQFRELFEAIKNQTPQLIQFVLPNRVLPSIEKPEIDSFQFIVDDVLMGNNVMLVGGAGTGKTYLAENLVAAKALDRKHITINCSQWTSPTEIIGGQTMDGYVEGKLIEAWKNGWVLVLDELPKIDPNTAGLLNDALAKTKIVDALIFNARKESFSKHPDFACIATGNVYPNKESMAYGANNKQDLSLLDRFSGSVYFIEKNPSIEKRIVQNLMVWSICDKLRNAIEELKYEAQLSLRFMQNARDSYDLEMSRLKDNNGIKANEGKNLKVAFDAYLSTFTDVQQKNLKNKMSYFEIFEDYDYRNFKTNQSAY
jgi:cobaltochelatase CobS